VSQHDVIQSAVGASNLVVEPLETSARVLVLNSFDPWHRAVLLMASTITITANLKVRSHHGKIGPTRVYGFAA
jgi:hypothetical protein